MPQGKTFFEELLNYWRYTREGVIAEVENLPEEDLDRRPGEAQRSVRDLALHVVEGGRLMAGELSRPDGDFTRKPYPELLAEHGGQSGASKTKADLVALLKTTHEEGDAALRAAGELHMMQWIRQFNGEQATRLSWMHHGLSHEDYHRGQIALTVRLLGHTPALTKAIRGES